MLEDDTQYRLTYRIPHTARCRRGPYDSEAAAREALKSQQQACEDGDLPMPKNVTIEGVSPDA